MKLPGYTDVENEMDVTPQMCRSRDLSYVCTLYCTVKHTNVYDDGRVEEVIEKKVEIGDIPVMVKSKNCILYGLDEEQLIKMGECPNDVGGYFILSGKERAIVAQERLSYNQLYVFPDKNGLKAEIRCHCEENDHQSTIHLKYSVSKKYGPCIKTVIPHIHEAKGVFLFSIFMVLGITDKEEIVRMILYPNYDNIEMREQLEGSIIENEQVNTREKAIAYLSQYVKPRTVAGMSQPDSKTQESKLLKRLWLIHIIDRELFPHLHPDQSHLAFEMQNQITVNVLSQTFQDYIMSAEFRKRCLEKAWFLAYSVNRLLRVALNYDDPR